MDDGNCISGSRQICTKGKKYDRRSRAALIFRRTQQTSLLKESLIKAGLKDGMTISTHHHFRNGDL